jgi:endoglucanase
MAKSDTLACMAAIWLAVHPLTGVAGDALLRTQGRDIVDAKGHVVMLRGFNLGGWIVLENFMSPTDSEKRPGSSWQPVHGNSYDVMKTLDARFGEATERDLTRTYQDAWIRPDDLDRIAAAGFNAVRVPLWWGQFFSLPGNATQNPSIHDFQPRGFDVLDKLVAEAGKRHIYVILDMHGAVGGQSLNGSTGQAGQNRYWHDAQAQNMTAWLWWVLADHFKHNPTVAGYDLLNEPDARASIQTAWTNAQSQAVLRSYDRLYRAVRSTDPDHMIFVEGTFRSWSWSELPVPATRGWSNVVYEFHLYPIDAKGARITNIDAINAHTLSAIKDAAAHAYYDVPACIGEFNPRSLSPAPWTFSIAQFDQAHMSWTSWSYKSVNGSVGRDFWGWYSVASWPQRPLIGGDSAAEIRRKWSLWTTDAAFAENVGLGIRP